MKFLFRTNWGENIGMGHLYRTLSLAKAIKICKPACKILFDVNTNSELLKEFEVILHKDFGDRDLNDIKSIKPDMIVFDSYLANLDYLKQLRDISKLVVFDDNNDIYSEIPANILINGNLHAKELKYESSFKDTKFLLGPKYLVMNPEYWQLKKIKDSDEGSILITTGGADFNKVMPKFIESLKSLNMKKRIIIGPAYENDEVTRIEKIVDNSFELIYKPCSLKQYVENSSIVMTAAGSTIYEILALKKVPIIYTLADNQLKVEEALKKFGVKSLGNFEKIEWDNLIFEIKEVMNSVEEYKKRLEPLYTLFDGKGALRVAKKILTR